MSVFFTVFLPPEWPAHSLKAELGRHCDVSGAPCPVGATHIMTET